MSGEAQFRCAQHKPCASTHGAPPRSSRNPHSTASKESAGENASPLSQRLRIVSDRAGPPIRHRGGHQLQHPAPRAPTPPGLPRSLPGFRHRVPRSRPYRRDGERHAPAGYSDEFGSGWRASGCHPSPGPGGNDQAMEAIQEMQFDSSLPRLQVVRADTPAATRVRLVARR